MKLFVMVVVVCGWREEPLDALAEWEEERVDGGSADERGWRDAGTETKTLMSSDGLRTWGFGLEKLGGGTRGSYAAVGVARVVGAIADTWVMWEFVGMDPKGSNKAAASCETAGSIFMLDAAEFTAGVTVLERTRGAWGDGSS
jgi:hypothetical protein